MSTSQWTDERHFLMERANTFPGPRCGNFWSDLSLPVMLPEAQVVALRNIVCRMSDADMSAVTIAVFTGRDAAGKLMAAEALAYEMQRPLHRVDPNEIDGLSPRERKTHFARILNAGKSENAILMLDRADDLPNALLQNLEEYPGLSILATDSAQEAWTVLDELTHSIVDFPFPFDNE